MVTFLAKILYKIWLKFQVNFKIFSEEELCVGNMEPLKSSKRENAVAISDELEKKTDHPIPNKADYLVPNKTMIS